MLYLTHYSIIDFIVTVRWKCASIVKFLIGIVFSFLVAIIMFYLFGYRKEIRLKGYNQ